MYTLRTRFKKEIIAEFLPPKRKSSKVIILCAGMPSVPAKTDLMDFFSKKGFWVFYPRYRGSWESEGQFLRISPHKDVIDVIDSLPKGFKDAWSGKIYKIKPKKIYLIGGSFGAPAMILASSDKRVGKVIAFSPVVDWTAPSKTEPIDFMYKFVREAFGKAFRISKNNWNKLKTGKFYNPMYTAEKINGAKLFLVHAKDDEVVSWKSVEKFAKKVNCKLLMLKKGGHLHLSIITKPFIYNKIKKFL